MLDALRKSAVQALRALPLHAEAAADEIARHIARFQSGAVGEGRFAKAVRVAVSEPEDRPAMRRLLGRTELAEMVRLRVEEHLNGRVAPHTFQFTYEVASERSPTITVAEISPPDPANLCLAWHGGAVMLPPGAIWYVGRGPVRSSGAANSVQLPAEFGFISRDALVLGVDETTQVWTARVETRNRSRTFLRRGGRTAHSARGTFILRDGDCIELHGLAPQQRFEIEVSLFLDTEVRHEEEG